MSPLQTLKQKTGFSWNLPTFRHSVLVMFFKIKLHNFPVNILKSISKIKLTMRENKKWHHSPLGLNTRENCFSVSIKCSWLYINNIYCIFWCKFPTILVKIWIIESSNIWLSNWEKYFNSRQITQWWKDVFNLKVILKVAKVGYA